MVRHKSAIKRHRQNVKRQVRNQSAKARLRTLVKKARSALDGGGTEDAAASVREAARALDKAVTKGVLHANNAARKISRLSARLARSEPAAALPASE